MSVLPDHCLSDAVSFYDVRTAWRARMWLPSSTSRTHSWQVASPIFEGSLQGSLTKPAPAGDCREFVREAMMMERGESSHGDRQRTLDQLLAGRDPNEVFAKDGLLDDVKFPSAS